jgi:hypothetical protein
MRIHLNFESQIRTDIRYPAPTGYPAKYPVSALGLAGHPANSVSGASLTQFESSLFNECRSGSSSRLNVT